MPANRRDIHNLPDPGTVASSPADLRDWLHRLYDVLSTANANAGGGLFTPPTTSGSTAYTPRQVFFGTEDGAFGQDAELFYENDLVTGDPSLLTAPRLKLSASDGEDGSAPIYFDSASVLLTNTAESCLENWDPWLYYTGSARTETTPDGGSTTYTSYRYQIMGLYPDRDGVAAGLIPFGIDSTSTGLCTTDIDLSYENQGETASNYLNAPRLYLAGTGNTTSLHRPPLQLATASASLIPTTGGAAGAYPTIPAPDTADDLGAIETDGNFLYFTTVGGTRRALAMHDSATGMVTGSGSANHIAYWSSATNLTYDSGQLYWDATNNRIGILTNAPSASLSVGSGSLFQVDSSGRVFAPNGSVGAGTLAYSFVNDTNTGFSRSAADTINVVTGGTERLQFHTTGMTMTDGLFLVQGTPPVMLSGNGVFHSSGGLYAYNYGSDIGRDLYINALNHIWSTYPAGGTGTATERARLTSAGRLLLGNTTDSDFLLRIAGDIGPNSDHGYDLGSSSLSWKDVYHRYSKHENTVAPTASGSGWGASASYAVTTGSADAAGIVVVTANTATTATPTVTITYGHGYSSHKGIPVVIPYNISSGYEGYCLITAYSATAFTFMYVCVDNTGAQQTPHNANYSFMWLTHGAPV